MPVGGHVRAHPQAEARLAQLLQTVQSAGTGHSGVDEGVPVQTLHHRGVEDGLAQLLQQNLIPEQTVVDGGAVAAGAGLEQLIGPLMQGFKRLRVHPQRVLGVLRQGLKGHGVGGVIVV